MTTEDCYSFYLQPRLCNRTLYYYGARYYDPEGSMWLSVDPLAHRDPHLTPYHFVSNNPVMIVDPDGRTGYRVDEKGNIVYADNTGGSEFDVIYNEDMSQTSLPIAPGVIGNPKEERLKTEKDGPVDVRTWDFGDNSSSADRAYDFLKEETKFEWAVTHGGKGESTRSFLTTSGGEGTEYGAENAIITLWNEGYEAVISKHNHPIAKDSYPAASGYGYPDKEKDGDRAFATNLRMLAKRFEITVPTFLIAEDIETGQQFLYTPWNYKRTK